MERSKRIEAEAHNSQLLKTVCSYLYNLQIHHLETMAKANEDMVHSALKEKNDDGRATA
jgi:hypothetical protein